MKVRRHGDLILILGEKKQNTKLDKSGVILQGQTHSHLISGGSFYKNIEEPTLSNDYFLGSLVVKKECFLTHAEHKTIALSSGTYEAYVQREYDPIEERRVLD